MLGVRTNDNDTNYLDFVLEGDAQGWIAIGFSPERGMVCGDFNRSYALIKVLNLA